MIAMPKEIIDQIEFLEGEILLKEGASEEQQKIFDSFLLTLKNSTQVFEDGDAITVKTV